MPIPQNKRNANSAPSAGAGGNAQPAAAPEGPLPVSALADALVNSGGLLSGDQTQVQPASPDAGGAAPDPGQEPGGPLEPGAQTEPGPEGAEVPGEGEPGGGEGQPAGELEPDPEQLPEGVQRRFGQLQAKIRDLETKLENAQQKAETAPAPETKPTGLESVWNRADLDARQDQAEQGLEDAEELLSRLQFAPQGVESYLRGQGVVLKDEQGNEDFSPERMAEVLNRARHTFRQTLRAIPRRAQFLEQYQAAHQQVSKVFPWLNDRTDERHAYMSQILSEHPALKSRPNYEYWVACAIEGHRAVQARASAPARNGNGAAPKPRPNTAQPGVARATNGAKAKVDQARQKVLDSGNKQALSAFFETTGFVR